MAQCHNRMQFNKCDDPNHLIDPTKPIGKILKGPNYTPPQLGPILAAGNWLSEPAKVHIDESTVTDRAKLAHCEDHPESTAENRSEERRGGNECVRTCRYRWAPLPEKKKHKNPKGRE